MNRFGLSGPFVVTVKTTGTTATQATYVAALSTLLATPADIANEAPTGTGFRIGLQSQVPPPVPGAAVVLPQSAAVSGPQAQASFLSAKPFGRRPQADFLSAREPLWGFDPMRGCERRT